MISDCEYTFELKRSVRSIFGNTVAFLTMPMTLSSIISPNFFNSSAEGVPKIHDYSSICNPSVSPGKRGVLVMSSKRMQPTAQMSIASLYMLVAKISSGAL